MTGRSIALSSALLAACSSGSTLTVDVRSDLVPDVEVDRFEVELYAEPPAGEVAPFDRVLRSVEPEGDYLHGVRVADFRALADGRRWIEVAALDAEGRVLVRQPADVNVLGITVREVIIDRECMGVECPAAGGSPSDLACLAGRCVDPRCTPASPEHCPDWAICERNADCDQPAAGCASAECTEGFCFSRAMGGACPAETWCNPESGCEPLPGAAPADAGPAGDAGCPDLPCALPNPCHAGVMTCGSDTCERAGNVVMGTPCDGGVCDGMGSCAAP